MSEGQSVQDVCDLHRGTQLVLRAAGQRGGAREGAGRPRSQDSGVAHAARARLLARSGRRVIPMHVTMRVEPGLPSLRSAEVWAKLGRALVAAQRAQRRGNPRHDLTVLHYSVQSNHVHLVVEATAGAPACAGAKGLAVRFARAINAALGRTGRVFADRYHCAAITSPTQMRHVYLYVLQNQRKHVRSGLRAASLDRCSSARWFAGFRDRGAEPLPATPPIAPPRTTLAAFVWRRALGGLLGALVAPRASTMTADPPRSDSSRL